MNLVTKQQQKVSEWSGGTTTELLISPINATVGEQNFDFRISTAKVLVEKSEFTSFPKHNRKLAILEGKLKIQHNQSDWYTLNAGEQTEFKGGWVTHSEGQVVDFNVIYNDNYQVELGFTDQLDGMVYMGNIELLGFYCINGMGSINGVAFHAGDFVFIQEAISDIESTINARFVQVKIIKL